MHDDDEKNHRVKCQLMCLNTPVINTVRQDHFTAEAELPLIAPEYQE